MKKVIYHGNCYDGMVAAWIAWKKFGLKAQYYSAIYGGTAKLELDLLQDCYENANINDEIYILDFSFKRDLLDQIHNKVKLLKVLDHHKTAQAELEGTPYSVFDMNKSGARLAWEYFYPNYEPPRLVTYVEDRDIWRKALTWTDEINAYIQSWPMNFETYEALNFTLQGNFRETVESGKSILRYKDQQVEVLCKKARLGYLGGHLIPIVNSPILMSEVGHELCKLFPNHSFAAYYFFREDGKIQWGLRSVGDFDVSNIAKSFGGGGHKNAAGFEVDPQGPGGSMPVYPFNSL